MIRFPVIMIYEPRNENLALFLESLVEKINVHFRYFLRIFNELLLDLILFISVFGSIETKSFKFGNFLNFGR